MIRCTVCNTINPSDALFCSNCNSFLEWTGVPASADEVAAAKTGTPAKPATEPVMSAEPAMTAAPQPAPLATPEPEPRAEPEPVEPAVEPTPAPEPKTAPPSEPTPPPELAVASSTEPTPVSVAREQPISPATPTWRPLPPPPPPPALARPVEPPAPPPEPVADTESLVKPAPEPVKEEFRYRAAPARRHDPVATTAPSPAAAQTAGAPAEPAARRPGFIAQVRQAIGVEADGTVPSTPAAPLAKNDQPVAVRPQPAQPAALRPQATEPPSRQPSAVKPAIPQKRRVSQPQKPPDEPEYRPGDLICANCGAGNDPARRFCRRCGTSLVTAIVAQKPPWYRRIFRGRNRALKAGERPRWMGDEERRSRVSWVHRLLGVQRLIAAALALAAVAGIGAYALVPNVRGQVNDGIDQVRRTLLPTYAPIIPTKFAASDSQPDHPVDLAFDQGSNTYWATRRADEVKLTVDFPRKFDLGVVVLQTSPADKFAQFDRPKTVTLSFPGSTAAPITLSLKDDKAPIISGGLNAAGVQQVVMTFDTYYPADQSGQDVVALVDVQFQERR